MSKVWLVELEIDFLCQNYEDLTLIWMILSKVCWENIICFNCVKYIIINGKSMLK